MIFVKSILFALAMGLIVQGITDIFHGEHSRPTPGAILAFFMSLPNYIRIERMMKE
jgi:uncharacterized membrane protein HdeD (DUF308 family)